MSLSEQLRDALQKQGDARAIIQDHVSRMEAGTWKEETDGAALKEARANLEKIDPLVKDLQDKAALSQRTADWTSTPTTGSPVSVNVIKPENRGDKVERLISGFSLLRAGHEMTYGKRSLDGIEAEVDQEGKREARESGFSQSGSGAVTLPSFIANQRQVNRYQQRDMLAETTTAGGYTVDTTLGSLIPILEPKLRVAEMGASIIRGLSSNIDFPRNDADASAVWAGEVTTSTETSPTFDRIQMAPERLTAFTDVSKQVALQSTIDMENFVRGRLNFANNKALDLAALNGSGSSNQPTGILNYSGVNDITIATDGGALDWALVVQFETETATDNADMGRLGYLFTPGVAGLLKTTKRDVAGNGFIWEGPNGNGNVNGYRALTTTQLPSTLSKGSSSGILHAAIFGNWAELIIGQWGGVDVLFNPYTKGKEAMIEIILNSWWDIEIRHAASFCICNEIDIS